MSNEVVPREGNITTIVTANMKQKDPNNPGQFIPLDLSLENGTSTIECQRPDKSRFEVSAAPVLPKVNGQLQFTDNLGILNQAGLWRFRGIARLAGSTIQVLRGSWFQQRVGD